MNITINLPNPVDDITLNFVMNGSTISIPVSAESMTMLESAQLEAKADDEVDMDFSGCKGFDVNFMGFKTPLPALGKQLKRKVAKLNLDPNAFVLKYNNFSTIHHSVRRMPVVSAINIDGNPVKRKDDRDRKDSWLRDNRIDFDIQLNDAFYKKSNFDKGHMCRREDADWGRTEAEAFRNAQMTCMYTNACPQVPDLNRAVYGYHGLWGQLEQIVLEKGVEEESGKTTRICVYNGPIFTPTDPVFRGVQIPLRFFKVIVWLNGAGEKKTTAFILSQEDLVGGVEFEELQYDEEFKEHQCSIEYLERATELTFTDIRDWDTFVNDGPGGKKVKSLDLNAMNELVAKNAGKN